MSIAILGRERDRQAMTELYNPCSFFAVGAAKAGRRFDRVIVAFDPANEHEAQWVQDWSMALPRNCSLEWFKIGALVESLRGFGEMPLEGGDTDPLIEVMHSLAHEAADRIEALESALREAENGFDRIHNALLSTGPKQACGEMALHFLTETRKAMTELEIK